MCGSGGGGGGGKGEGGGERVLNSLIKRERER